MPKRLTILLLILTIFAGTAWARDLAIVVNPGNPVDELSRSELIKIFRVERRFWASEKIILLTREQDSWEKELVLEKIYNMSADDLNKFWLTKIFTGEIPAAPAVVGTEFMLKRLVQRLPGAIAYIDSESVDSNVKVLRIDGKLPGDSGYLLREK